MGARKLLLISMNTMFYLAVGLVSLLGLTEGSSQNASDQQRLFDHLFSNYNKQIRPNVDNQPTEIQVAFFPYRLIDFDEKNQIIYLGISFSLNWADAQLQWNTSEFGGIELIHFPQSNFWLPPLRFPDSVTKIQQIGDDGSLVRLHPFGYLGWNVWQNVALSCKVDISFYPFDIQKCDVKINFNPLTTKELISKSIPKWQMAVEYLDSGGTWELIDHYCFDQILKPQYNGFSTHRYVFVLKRRSTFYVLNIILPVVLLSTTASVVFLL